MRILMLQINKKKGLLKSLEKVISTEGRNLNKDTADFSHSLEMTVILLLFRQHHFLSDLVISGTDGAEINAVRHVSGFPADLVLACSHHFVRKYA